MVQHLANLPPYNHSAIIEKTNNRITFQISWSYCSARHRLENHRAKRDSSTKKIRQILVDKLLFWRIAVYASKSSSEHNIFSQLRPSFYNKNECS